MQSKTQYLVKSLFIILITTQFLGCSTYKKIDEVLNPTAFDTNSMVKKEVVPTISDTQKVIKEKVEPTTLEIKNIIETKLLPITINNQQSLKNMNLEFNYKISTLYQNLLNVQATNLRILEKVAGSNEEMKKEVNNAIQELLNKQIAIANNTYLSYSKLLDNHRTEINNKINKLNENSLENKDSINKLNEDIKVLDTQEKEYLLQFLTSIETKIKTYTGQKDKKIEKLLAEISDIKQLAKDSSISVTELKGEVEKLRNKNQALLEVNIGAVVNEGNQSNFNIGNND